ncbi:MAG: hypothetical protein CVU89_08415 [Firmicutes bacterium HGW-Firmicutes-14]|nr:MAG: hypothetical protein CVU89_08415 [Firmicutes bacterium HGW-Firmicutes-14]
MPGAMFFMAKNVSSGSVLAVIPSVLTKLTISAAMENCAVVKKYQAVINVKETARKTYIPLIMPWKT